ncbi:iron-containing alcohol dehydrogenase [Roseobacter sp.]|uniref:iron-containing alcohol dehydrogenase n=1 Tax=Roseobacter sp. TaxID=1907202 RepID=UPI00385CA0E7
MNLQSFEFAAPGRIAFGRGTRDQIAASTLAFGSKVLLVRGRSVPWVDTLENDLRENGGGVTSIFSVGEPTVADVEAALETGRAADVDVVVAVGGGATIDLGKVVAAMLPASGTLFDHLEGVGLALPLESSPLPFIAAPTTSGTGAEITKNTVIAVPTAGRKVSLRDARMVANLAVVDPALTDGLPREQTLLSGLDALTQVIEPYISCRANLLTDALCRAAIPLGAKALGQLALGEDRQARDDMAYVSLSSGLALANSGLGAVHGLAGVLGGRLCAPHGLICGRLMGPILEANKTALKANGQNIERLDDVASWLGQGLRLQTDQVFKVLPRTLDQWHVPRLLAWISNDISLEEIAEEAAGASSMKANPCVLSTKALVAAMQLAL